MTESERPVYALIMAGGVGRRFWPLSRRDQPKQFLRFFGERSLLQMTSERLEGLVPLDRQFIVTNRRYVEQTVEQLPKLSRNNILAEPVSRNTGPCIAYGATRIGELHPEGVMLVLPADHLIQDVPAFHEAVRLAVETASSKGVLVTMGIRPTYPASGFGYIEYDAEQDRPGRRQVVYDVVSFTEKPDAPTAETFVESGRYLWNSGMFVWRVDTILAEFKRNMPKLYTAFGKLVGAWDDSAAIAEAFAGSPNISIDYGVMEHAGQVKVVRGDFGWNDVGDWQAAYDLSDKDADGNASKGSVKIIESSGCLAYSTERRIVLVGTSDLVVVDAGNTVLVCDRSQAQRVKEAANAAGTD